MYCVCVLLSVRNRLEVVEMSVERASISQVDSAVRQSIAYR